MTQETNREKKLKVLTAINASDELAAKIYDVYNMHNDLLEALETIAKESGDASPTDEMNIKYKDYAVTHDGDNYVVNKVSIVSAEKGKPENVRKESYKKLKYYSTLKSALKSIRDMVITDGLDDVDGLIGVINKIEALDTDFQRYLDGVVR